MIAGRCQNPKFSRADQMQHTTQHRSAAIRARPSTGLSGAVRAPADKSVSHRAVIMGAMAEGTTDITGLLEGDDVLATVRAAAALGAAVERTDPGEWRVTGPAGGWRSPADPLDFGNSGTGARLMLGAAAGYALTARFDGDASLRARPMERIAAPLRLMGARIDTANGRLPATLTGGGLDGIAYDSPVASAQIKSAVLLAGLNAAGETTVREPAASRDHTEQMLAAFGAPPHIVGNAITVQGGGRLTAAKIGVPGDPSSAAFLAAAAALTEGSAVTIRNVMTNPLRTEFFSVLARMGADLEWSVPPGAESGDAPADLTVRSSALIGVLVEEASIPAMIDEVPILAVCAANAYGVTRIEGLAELRVKESDRLLAVADLLRANGVDCETGEDWLEIEGRGENRAPGGGLVETRHDHRIAMSALVLGLAARNEVTIDDESMIATSYPDFFAHMTALGADISR